MDFDQLIDKIETKKVIPFVGNELLFVKKKYSDFQVPIEDFLAKELANNIGIDFKNQKLKDIASQVFKDHDIYGLIRSVYQGIGVNRRYQDYFFDLTIFDKLIDLGFTTFLSISFADILEKRLIERWGTDKVNIVNYSLSQVSQTKAISQNTSQKIDDKEFTVINLLGSIKGDTEFAVTEEEYLEYFFNIISGSNALFALDDSFVAKKVRDNSIIYLGCSYPVWYTRYIVRGITQKRYTMHRLLNNILLDEERFQIDASDKSFLENFKSIILGEANFNIVFNESRLIPGRNFSETIINTLHNKITDIRDSRYVGQVFICYYSNNKQISESTNEYLRLEKISTWYDENHLQLGEHEENIREAIRNCKIFLPIITDELLLAKTRSESGNEEMPYSIRFEWSTVIDRYSAEKFNNKGDVDKISFKIMPCIIDGLKRDDERIPKLFRDQKIYTLTSERERLLEDVKKYLTQKK